MSSNRTTRQNPVEHESGPSQHRRPPPPSPQAPIVGNSQASTPAGRSATPNDRLPLPTLATDSPPHDVSHRAASGVYPLHPEDTSFSPTSITQPTNAVPITKRVHGFSLSSVKSAFKKAKDNSLRQLPSMAGLVAGFLGLANEFEEMDVAEQDLIAMAQAPIVGNSQASTPAGRSATPNDRLPLPTLATDSPPHDVSHRAASGVYPLHPEDTSFSPASITQPANAAPITKRVHGFAWSSVKIAFKKAKDNSVRGSPSMARFAAGFLGLADEFEEMDVAEQDLIVMAHQLEKFIDAIAKLNARTDLMSDSDFRASLEQIDAYINTERAVLSDKSDEMRRSGYISRAAMARDVTKNVAKLVARVHGDVLELLLHIQVTDMSHMDDVIRTRLRPVSMAAIFATQNRGCLAGTRKMILARLLAWAKDPAEPRIFWLSGMAGIGKTAITQSFCDSLYENNIFAPSFFCSRRTSVNDHQDVMRIIPTLSALMGQKYPKFKSALLTALASLGPDRDPLSLALEEQFRVLLRTPLSDLKEPLPNAVLIIDALDELGDPHLMGEFLDVLLRVAESLSVKFFLTSRPEDQVRFRFTDHSSKRHNVLRLHDVEQDLVQADIRLYLTQKLKTIPRFNLDDAEFNASESTWPTSSQLDRLVQLVNNLFLYAATVIRYLAKEDCERRLQRLLNAQSTIATASLDDTYRFILSTAFAELEPDEMVNRNRCLGTLICARRPLSIQDMADLLDMDASDVTAAFRPLHSVVYVPTSPTGTVSTFHASFQEYLTNEKRSKADDPWFVNVPQTHLDLASTCFRLMSALKFNIAQSNSSCLDNTDESQGANVSAHLSYCCRYGVEHLRACHQPPSSLVISYTERLCEKFLYWLEVLSVIGQIDQASRLLMEFQQVIRAQVDFSRTDIREFLIDGNEFVIRFQEPISLSAPHVYISALPFAATSSQIAQGFQHLFPHTVRVKGVTHRRQASLLKLLSHTDSVNFVAFSPDSTRIVSGSDDKTIRVWDATTGREVCEPLEGHTGWVMSVAFSPDSTRIVSGSADKTIRVWDATTGREVCEPLEGHTDRVCSVAFSPDSTRIVSGSADKTIRVWDATTGREVCEPLEGHTDRVWSVAFSPDSTRIVSGSYDKTIRVWDAMTGREVCEPFEGHTRSVLSVAFSPDSTRIVSGSADKTIRVWDATTGREVCEPLKRHTEEVMSVAFSPDSTRIVSGSADKTIRVWDATTGREVCEPFEGHTRSVSSVAFSPDSTRIVSGSVDNTIRVWDATTGREVCEPLEGHTRRVLSVAFSPDSTRIVSGSADETIRVWDATTGREVCEPLEGHTDRVWSVAFSPDSTRIVSGSTDKTIRVWDATTGREVCEPLEGHTDWVLSVAFSPDSTRIVSGSVDNTIRVWDATTGREVCEPLEGHTCCVVSVAFSPDSTRIVSGSTDETIRVWDATTGREVCEPLEGHTDAVLSVAFSPDSTRIVSGSEDKTIGVWDAMTGREVCEPLEGHTDSVSSVAFSPDSTRIVSGSADKTIRVWDATTGREVCEPLEGHTDSVSSVAFSPDSTRIVSGSEDRTIRVWDAKAEAREASIEPLADGSLPFSSSEAEATAAPSHTHYIRLQQEGEESSGCAVSSSGKRLFWVPEEFRTGLVTPRTLLVIGAKRCEVDLTDFVYGEDWARCYVGPVQS